MSEVEGFIEQGEIPDVPEVASFIEQGGRFRTCLKLRVYMTPDAQTRQLRDREKSLARLAARQHGVVSRPQLLALGFGVDAIKLRLGARRLHPIHRGVYAVGHARVNRHGRWLAAVFAHGEGALLSHRSAAALWGLMRARAPVDVTSPQGRSGRAGTQLHHMTVSVADRAKCGGIPVTSVPRTLFDLAEVLATRRLERVWEEADRLNLLELRELEAVCDRHPGRHALRPTRRMIEMARAPVTASSPLEIRFKELCAEHGLPPPATNARVLDFEVDALWQRQRLVVELDGFAYHRHRAAFERDRARDAALLTAGYRVIRVTHRRLEREAAAVAAELRELLANA